MRVARELPGTDLLVSPVWLGGEQLGGRSFGPIDESTVAEILSAAMDGGISVVDVAPVYGRGRTEELVGKLLRGREDITIVTKAGLSWGDDLVSQRNGSPAAIQAGVESSLRRLRRDVIDVCLLHWIDPEVPVTESIGALAELQRRGLIHHIGVSNCDVVQLAAATTEARLAAVQCRLNLLDARAAPVAFLCAEMRIGFIAYSPLASGVLTGRFQDTTAFHDGRSRYEAFRGDELRVTQDRVAAVTAIGRGSDRTSVDLALDFVLCTPGVTAAVVGATSVAQIESITDIVRRSQR